MRSGRRFFTHLNLVDWSWYYLSTVLDDYSRLIVAWRLCTGMGVGDVSETLDDALRFTGLDNLTPADVFYGRGKAILNKRKQIKTEIIAMRKQMHYDRRTPQPTLMS